MKVTQGHPRNCYSISHMPLPISGVSNSISVLHRFRDITTFVLYITACDIEKSFSFVKTVEIASHVRFQVHV